MTQREELVAWELSFHRFSNLRERERPKHEFLAEKQVSEWGIRMASILEQRETLGVEDGKIPVRLTKLGLVLEWCVLLGRGSSVL
ncbi:hypothetical protein Pyn_38072 [Prunus yedoensis var. nudiflora]|uniref:Uncharacterized protein n=1 Tax=Prunus yedoensis var. nudiflora TaxID=2094558 RepID=A0A314ZGH7_PRUYE|nr:hypothetical protein Pyn_38072 [Prunus yedoensis var. nudiflora]